MKAAVIGLGYVGLPLAIEIARAGFEVYGIEIDRKKAQLVNNGKSYVVDISDQEVKREVKRGRLKATANFDALKEVKAISICVPTPLRKTKDPDISYIYDAILEVAQRLQKGQIIVLESTTYPGTTEDLLLPELSKTGLKVGKDFFLAFSPERVDPGNIKYKTKNIPKIVGGITPQCTNKAAAYYGKVFDQVVKVSSAKSAEMVKLLENTFRSVNIGLVNEIALMCDRLGLDVWEVIDAAKTKPFGFMAFYPGPGLGGHCIPIDPLYLSWKLKSLNYYARFIELASDINSSMPRYVFNKIVAALNTKARPLKNSQVLIIGVAYKRDIGDFRESPALDIIELLRENGAIVSYNDPYVDRLQEFDLNSVKLSNKTLGQADCVVIVTDHSYYNYKSICDNARMVVDTRNATKGIRTNTPVIKI